jgi:ATP-binding protein involved in chromosome partitioning
MSSLTEAAVTEKLKEVKYPGFTRDIVSFGLVKAVSIEGEKVGVRLAVTTANPEVPKQLHAAVVAAVKSLPGVKTAEVMVETAAPVRAAMQAGGLPQNKIEGVRHVIAVASGKGGVGKSTVAANLAAALRQEGAKVGLCDCDIYGPSVALMFGSKAPVMATEDDRLVPVEQYGIRLMSMGFLLTENAPAILRGPMVTRYTQELLRRVDWGELDYLVLDLPPGTGDIQLTIVQTVALSGGIIVTTTQEVALIDARKAAAMFQKVNVPVLGIVENMSYFAAPDTGKRYEIFGSGGGETEAKRLGVPLLGKVPIEIPVRESGDAGKPIVLAQPKSEAAAAFSAVARQIMKIAA